MDEYSEFSTMRRNSMRKQPKLPGSDAPGYDIPRALIRRRPRDPSRGGRRFLNSWILEFEMWGRREIEPLMGWTSSNDPYASVRLEFPNLESAVEFAESRGWRYTISEAPARRQQRNYQTELTNRLRYGERRNNSKQDRKDRTAIQSVEPTRQNYDPVDEALIETCPASDPPAWTGAALR